MPNCEKVDDPIPNQNNKADWKFRRKGGAAVNIEYNISLKYLNFPHDIYHDKHFLFACHRYFMYSCREV